MTTLILPLPPLLNRYYRKYRNIMVVSADGLAFKHDVMVACINAGIEPLTGDVVVQADIYRKAKRGDLDGYLKALLDAMQGYAYMSDSQIVELHIRRFEDKHNPRCEVQVSAANGILS